MVSGGGSMNNTPKVGSNGWGKGREGVYVTTLYPVYVNHNYMSDTSSSTRKLPGYGG